MRITTHKSIRSDILHVVANMSEQTAEDFRLLGKSAAQIMLFLLSRVYQRSTTTFARANGEPIMVLGWDKSPLAWYSWFIATPAGYSDDARPVFALKREIRKVQRENPDVELRCIALQDTPKVRRWLACLGCKEVVRGGVTVWLFVG